QIKSKVGSVRQARLFRTVAQGVGNRFQNCVLHSVSQTANPSVHFAEVFHCQFRSSPKADDARDIFCSAAPTALLMTTGNVRMIRRAPLNVEKANSLWGMQLVGGERKEICSDRFDINLQFARRLDGVDMIK